MHTFSAPPLVVLWLLALYAGVITLGLLATHLCGGIARLLPWLVAVAAVAGADCITDHDAPGFRMLALCGAALFGMKGVVGTEAARSGTRLDPRSWVLFCVAWFGMRPSVFARRNAGPLDGTKPLLRLGVRRMAQGLALVGAAIIMGPHVMGPWPPGLLCMVGLSLTVHFGLFNVLAGLWRHAGYNTKALFRAPLRATSLREFWGQRWNLAFSEMAAIAVFRPLRGRLGRGAATTAAFLFSGLLHELAISGPVRSGWGLPLLYFAIHATLMIVEDALERRGHPIHRNPRLGRIWTVLWLLLPFPILFHASFRTQVVWPIFGG